MSSFPLDLTTEILCRLAVKEVVRFRCVLKSWCSLIDTPCFRKLHLSLSSKSEPNVLAIVSKSKLIKFLDLEFPSLLPPRIIPNQPRHDTKCIVGSCNGLVALCNKVNTITLWNPFTGESRKLPQSNIFPQCRHKKSIAYGFGYDPTTADYKLLKITPFNYKKSPKRTRHYYNFVLCYGFDKITEIYSLKTNSWREISGYPVNWGYSGFRYVAGILAENALHWLTQKYETEPESPHIPMDQKIIAGFDLVGEEFYSVPIPDCFYGAFSMTMATLDGHLSVAARYENGCVDVWVMEEYGVKESWNKTISMTQEKVPLHYSMNNKVFPLTYSREGDKLLVNWRGKLFWYDLESEEAEFDNGQGILVDRNVMILTATLVALKDTSEIDGKRKQIVVKDENSKNNKKRKTKIPKRKARGKK